MKQHHFAKKVFLLSRSVTLHNKQCIGEYDVSKEVNVFMSNGKLIPTILCSARSVTESKTLAALGDDDPDIDAELCYLPYPIKLI